LLQAIREQLKNPKDIQKSVESLQAENNELKKRTGIAGSKAIGRYQK
jgi:cell shape-determining protein MreC